MAQEQRDQAGEIPGRIAELAGPLADAEGVELVDIEVKGQRNSRMVRLVADAEDGLGVDRIAALSRSVGEALEENDVIAGAYTLEVTSPGADRPLRSPRDFRRNVGREVRVVRTAQAAKAPDVKGELTGTVVAADDEVVTVETDGSPQRIALADIDYGKVVLPW
jgi:ribosome maturation factor RimP